MSIRKPGGVTVESHGIVIHDFTFAEGADFPGAWKLAIDWAIEELLIRRRLGMRDTTFSRNHFDADGGPIRL